MVWVCGCGCVVSAGWGRLAGSGWWVASEGSFEREAVEHIDVVRAAHHVVARRAAREAHPAEQGVGHDHGAEVLELWRVGRLGQLPHLGRVQVRVQLGLRAHGWG